MVSLRFPRPNRHLIPRWRSDQRRRCERVCQACAEDQPVKILRGQLALPVIDRRQTRADRIALIRHRLNGFDLRQAAREERRRRRRPEAERETRHMSLLESAGE